MDEPIESLLLSDIDECSISLLNVKLIKSSPLRGTPKHLVLDKAQQAQQAQ